MKITAVKTIPLGGSTHDHFEWHPSVIPANWPASSYGYTVIGPTTASFPPNLSMA